MNITLFITYCLVITITPGPTNIMVLSTVQNSGVKKAIQFAYGSLVAFFILLVLSVIINSLLVSVLPRIIVAMQIVGSIYMLYLAYKIFRASSGNTSTRNFASFKTGFIMQFLNPKPVIFTMTVIPTFVMPHYTSYYALFGFVLIITLVGLFTISVWVFSGLLLKSILERHHKLVNTFMALFLVYCAIIISGVV